MRASRAAGGSIRTRGWRSRAMVKADDHDIPVLMQSSEERVAPVAAQLGARPSSHKRLAQLLGERAPASCASTSASATSSSAAPTAALSRPPRTCAPSSRRCDDARRFGDLSRRPQRLLDLAHGAHRVRSGEGAAPGARRGVRIRRRACARICSRRSAAIATRRKPGSSASSRARPSTPPAGFTRIGSGSLGGKGRGLAFISWLTAVLPRSSDRFPGVRIFVPPTAVVATGVFDRFMRRERARRARAARDRRSRDPARPS